MYVGQAQISLQFRTYIKDATLFVVSAASGGSVTPLGANDYYGLYIQAGRVTLAISSPGGVIQLRSLATYNNGLWCQVS